MHILTFQTLEPQQGLKCHKKKCVVQNVFKKYYIIFSTIMQNQISHKMNKDEDKKKPKQAKCYKNKVKNRLLF